MIAEKIQLRTEMYKHRVNEIMRSGVMMSTNAKLHESSSHCLLSHHKMMMIIMSIWRIFKARANNYKNEIYKSNCFRFRFSLNERLKKFFSFIVVCLLYFCYFFIEIELSRYLCFMEFNSVKKPRKM